MLKKTLIAFAALSGIAVMFPAQAEDCEQSYRAVRHHQAPQIRFVIYQHPERIHYRHYGNQGHHEYRHHEYRENHGRADGWGHRQGHRAHHRGNHH